MSGSLVFSSFVAAQQVGFRDLTTQVVGKSSVDTLREDEQKDPQCALGIKELVGDGAATLLPPDPDLRLSIVKVHASKLELDKTFDITVKLENTGSKSVKVPWQLMPKPLDPAKPETTTLPSVLIAVRISDQRSPSEKRIGYLKAAPQLFADVANSDSFKTISPAEWVALRMRVRATCSANNDLCDRVEEGGRFWLSVVWDEYQHEISHERCYLGTGGFPGRHLASESVPVSAK